MKSRRHPLRLLHFCDKRNVIKSHSYFASEK